MKNNNHTKIFSWRAAVLLLAGIGLLTAGLSVFFQARSQSQIVLSFPAKNLKPVEIEMASAVEGFGYTFEAPGLPIRLLIPKIGVDTSIEGVGLSKTGNGDMDVPTKLTDVAWYNQGPLPGMPGSAVIAGHLNGKKILKGVFYNISSLKPGDLVKVIDKNGKKLEFKVTGSKVYDQNASASDVFFSDNSKSRLNLITCAGDWIKSEKLYNKRMVVFAELITAN